MLIRSRCACVLAFALVPALAFGQRTTTGTVAGKIVDSSGAVLPGVTLSLTSPEALGQFSAITDAQGLYRVTNLPQPRNSNGSLLGCPVPPQRRS